jgi:hypothetical protein
MEVIEDQDEDEDVVDGERKGDILLFQAATMW